jgi:starvation-inducible DNA-binding protein
MEKTGKTDASRRNDTLATPTDLDPSDVEKVAEALNGLAADAFVLIMKTKNFHWHMSGSYFRDYHLLLDEQADQIYATIDPLTDRATTLTSLSDTLKRASLKEQTRCDLSAEEMLRELLDDNKEVAKAMREAHSVCDDAEDIASASLIENYVDDTERRVWFLFETTRR